MRTCRAAATPRRRPSRAEAAERAGAAERALPDVGAEHRRAEDRLRDRGVAGGDRLVVLRRVDAPLTGADLRETGEVTGTAPMAPWHVPQEPRSQSCTPRRHSPVSASSASATSSICRVRRSRIVWKRSCRPLSSAVARYSVVTSWSTSRRHSGAVCRVIAPASVPFIFQLPAISFFIGLSPYPGKTLPS